MSETSIILAFTACISFFAAALGFSTLTKKSLSLEPFYIILALFFIGFSILFYINPIDHDIIHEISYFDALTALAFSLIISLSAKYKNSTIYIIVLGSIIGSLFVPHDFLLFEGKLHPIIDRFSIALIWFLLSYSFKYLNVIDGIATIQTTAITLGIFLIYLFGATAFLLAALSILIVFIMGTFYLFTATKTSFKLSNHSTQALGFIISWLIIKLSQEGGLSCGLIFSSFLLLEAVTVFIQKFLPNKKLSSFERTNVYAFIQNNYSPLNINISYAKICVLLVILGVFQIFAHNPYSVLIVSLLFTFWFISKLRGWYSNMTFKEANLSLANEIKENLKELRKGKND